MDLPLARNRGRDSQTTYPNQESFRKLIEVVTRSEAGQYLVHQLKKDLKEAAKNEFFPQLFEKTKEFAAYLKLKESGRNRAWFGEVSKVIEDASGLYARWLEEKAVQSINHSADPSENTLRGKTVQMDYAINQNDCHFLRRYLHTSNGGGALSKEDASEMDGLFNAFLAKNKLLKEEDGGIYRAVEKGDKLEILLDNQKNKISMNSDELRTLISSPTSGFDQYLAAVDEKRAQNDKLNIQVELKECKYPEKTPASQENVATTSAQS